MIKVITYGTYDVLHYGHVKLLERAKALGDYLVVGVTSDDFDKKRGKINNKQSLVERMAAVKALGIADEVIVEEYEGQKIEDIKKYDIDIFTVGTDWEGKFDYLKEYCQVIYLLRTEGISSSEVRAEENDLKIKSIGTSILSEKFKNECSFVNGVDFIEDGEYDAVYIMSDPKCHYDDIIKALNKGKHVLCESPISLSQAQTEELFELARNKDLVLMEAIKTAYSTAFSRMLLLIKGGNIGEVLSVDAICTSLKYQLTKDNYEGKWNSIMSWGPSALLPVFQILGTKYRDMRIYSRFLDDNKKIDGFTKIDFVYPNAVASIKVAKAAKSEGELVITGTKGYVYVPSPWWKTDYFEIRYENNEDKKKFFYQLSGEGIRNEIVAFVKTISEKRDNTMIGNDVSYAISRVFEEFENGNIIEI